MKCPQTQATAPIDPIPSLTHTLSLFLSVSQSFSLQKVEKLSARNNLLEDQAKQDDGKSRTKLKDLEAAADKKCQELQIALNAKQVSDCSLAGCVDGRRL